MSNATVAEKLEIRPGNVPEITVEEDCVLHPLIPLGNWEGTCLLATIVFDLLDLGYTFKELRERFWAIPREWTAKAVRRHVAEHGRTVVVRIPGDPRDTRYIQTTAERGVQTAYEGAHPRGD